jgi:type VI secretion system secreted protein Hcp
MSYTCFVEFDSPISNWSEAISYSFGYQGGGGASGMGTGSSRASVSGFTFTKKPDSLSAKLFQHSAAGTRFATVWAELYRDDDEDPYLTYELTDVIISSYQINGTAETLGLNYKKVGYSYFT